MTGPALPSQCGKLLHDEESLFEREYKKYYLEGETKPIHIGAPYLLHRPESNYGVLLIHGFMAAPHEVREWADHLFAKGFTVYAPRLAGHGTSADDLARRTYPDWIKSVDRGYQILKLLCKEVIVAGFSTGAGLALSQAILHPDRYCAVVSVSAPLQFKGLSTRFSRVMEFWNRNIEALGISSFRKYFSPNHPDNPEINYHRCPIHGLNQVKALMRNVHRGLPGLSVQALIIQGNHDPKVDPRSGPMIYERITGIEKVYEEINFNCHGIVRGEIALSVFSFVDEFLSRVMKTRGT